MKYITLIALLISATANADWDSWSGTDAMTGTRDLEVYGIGREGNLYSNNRYTRIGFRCQINKAGEKLFNITFDAAEVFAAKSSKVIFMLKIDNNEVRQFEGRTYSNSNEQGTAPMWVDHPIVAELMAGNTALVRLADRHGSHIVDFSVSLRGSTAQITKAVNMCQ